MTFALLWDIPNGKSSYWNKYKIVSRNYLIITNRRYLEFLQPVDCQFWLHTWTSIALKDSKFNGTDLTNIQSLLYGCPAGAIASIAIIASGYFGDRFGQRILVSSFGLLIAIIGMILIVALPLTNNGGRLAGYYMAQVSTLSFVALLSLIASNVAGYTKKTTVAALFLIAYCAGNIIGQAFFFWKDTM